MTKPEFAPELIEHIARSVILGWNEAPHVTKEMWRNHYRTVLRASSYADLVEVLEEAFDDLKRHVGATQWRTDPQLFDRINAALKAAGREVK